MFNYQLQRKRGKGEPERRPPSERREVPTNSQLPAIPKALHHPGDDEDDSDDDEDDTDDDGGNGSEKGQQW